MSLERDKSSLPAGSWRRPADALVAPEFLHANVIKFDKIKNAAQIFEQPLVSTTIRE